MTHEFHDPLPPGVHCPQVWHTEFEDWFVRYTELCKEGYWCRPSTHMFIAWLAGRGRRAQEEGTGENEIISSSPDAQRFMREFILTETPHAPHNPRTGA